MTPASENTTIPPTLLRLPDLDPEASTMLQTVPPTEHESAPSPQGPNPFAKPKAALAATASTSSSQPPPKATAQKAFESPVAKSSVPGPSYESTDSASLHLSDASKSVGSDARTTEASISSDESDSWLTTFASRKTLLVLLAIVAGLAIFFPRRENATSEQGTPLLVEESAPNPTVVPFQLEQYPATRLESPIASANQSNGPRQQLADPAKAIPRSPTSTASVPLRPPSANSIKNEIASADQQTASMIPQPPKTPWDEQTTNEQMESPISSSEPLDDVRAFGHVQQVNPYQQTHSPQSPVIEPSFAGNIDNERSRQSMANANGDDSITSEEKTEAPARLVNSRTPQGIFNWKKFLPPMNSDSGAASPKSPDLNQSTTTSSVMPEIRTSNAPVAPTFEFALPGGTNSAALDSADASDSSQSNPNGSPILGPEARVAMPPQSSLR